jgi:hypothetical protein
LAALVVFVLVWFEPQQLFVDKKVDEALPAPTTIRASATPTHAARTYAEPLVLATGSFVGREHATHGSVRVLELGDESRIVRLEGFETSNGPDVYVYLSTNAAHGPNGAFDDDYVSLGSLKGNIGDQNYDLPVDVDVARFNSVVIWCKRFSSAFGAADLAVA